MIDKYMYNAKYICSITSSRFPSASAVFRAGNRNGESVKRSAPMLSALSAVMMYLDQRSAIFRSYNKSLYI